MPIDYVRVTDEVKPSREYTIVASAVVEGVHKVLDKPATEADGTPLPPKYAPDSLSTNSGQSAGKKEN